MTDPDTITITMTRRKAIAVCIVLALLFVAAAMAVVRRRASTIVDERGRETASVQTVEVFGEREQWVLARDVETRRDEVRVVYRERLPDGTEREHETVTIGTHVAERTDAGGTRDTEAAKVERVEVVREVERRVEVHTPPPAWLLGPQIGAGSMGVMYGGQIAGPLAGPLRFTVGGMVGGGEWLATGGVALALP